MRNQYLNFLIALIFCLEFLSCDKPRGTEASLIGKWYVDSIQVKQNTNGVVDYTTVYRYSAKINYWDYRVDNKLYRYNNGFYDTIPYTLGTDNKGQRFVQYTSYSADSIKTLTNNLLVFIDPQGGSSKLFFSK